MSEYQQLHEDYIRLQQQFYEFRKKVEQMRKAQKSFFKTKTQQALQQSKMLEKEIDKIIAKYHNPTIF